MNRQTVHTDELADVLAEVVVLAGIRRQTVHTHTTSSASHTRYLLHAPTTTTNNNNNDNDNNDDDNNNDNNDNDDDDNPGCPPNLPVGSQGPPKKEAGAGGTN